MSEIINLDDGVQEYTEFILFGKKYKFRQFNTSEVEELQKISSDESRASEAEEYLSKFITAVDPDALPFEQVKSKMLVGHWKNLKRMIYTIMGIDENTSTENTPKNTRV